MTDNATRFLFEDADVRGELTHLETSLREILAIHRYPQPVARLLGEFLAASVLLAGNLKFEGRLSLQVRGDGQLPLVMAECSSELQVRALARQAHTATSVEFVELLGSGQLAITVDPASGQRYQGVVPLQENSLAACLQTYFAQSEQLHTWIRLACDGERAGGMLLQQLPATLSTDKLAAEDQWQHAMTLAATLQQSELLDLDQTTLLYRLYHQDPLRLFEPRRVTFDCSCSRQRTLSALATLGSTEVEDILKEQGAVTMDCEFCNRQYRYQRRDLSHLLDQPAAPTLH